MRTLWAVAAVVFSAPAWAQSSNAEGDWRMAGKDGANTRFSSLAEITSANAAQLRLAASFDTGQDRGQEAAPIVADGMLFVVGPYPNPVYAFDLAQPGFPLKWKFEPLPEPSAQGVACCDVVNRGAA